jgi:hypothetical protein
MYTERINRITERLTYIENRFESTLPSAFEENEYDEFTDEVYLLEEEVLNLIDECNQANCNTNWDANWSNKWDTKLLGLKHRIKELMENNEFYDPDDMLNMMFPSRQDDDYDEDDDNFSADDFFDHD